jgi:hypothetical protein
MRKIEQLIQAGQLWSPDSQQAPLSLGERVPLGVSEIDGVLGGGLLLGAVHEFLTAQRNPPVYVFSRIASQAFSLMPKETKIFWIGVEGLAPGEAFNDELIARSIILTPGSVKEQLWAITRALSHPLPSIVVGSFKNLKFTLTQRLSVLSRSSKSLCLVLRDLKDLKTPSAAHTRWSVKPFKSAQPAASFELVQNKGGGVLGNWALELQDFKLVSNEVVKKLPLLRSA